ncbi:hypothetical protein BH10ACI3_BH10ACI3_02580 [soil metagenome]
MRKDNLMSLVLGVVVGLAIGFVFANSASRAGAGIASVPPANTLTNAATGSNPALPANHPPLGNSTEDQILNEPQPQIEAAIEKAKTAPRDFEAQMTAADLSYQTKKFGEAAEFYEAAIKLKPNDIEALTKAGNAYFDSQKYELAEKYYHQVLQIEPKNVSVRSDLGLTYFLRTPRDIDMAIKEYKIALSIDPKHEVSLQNLALAYNEKGDKKNFLDTFGKLKGVNADNPLVTKTIEK